MQGSPRVDVMLLLQFSHQRVGCVKPCLNELAGEGIPSLQLQEWLQCA